MSRPQQRIVSFLFLLFPSFLLISLLLQRTVYHSNHHRISESSKKNQPWRHEKQREKQLQHVHQPLLSTIQHWRWLRRRPKKQQKHQRRDLASISSSHGPDRLLKMSTTATTAMSWSSSTVEHYRNNNVAINEQELMKEFRNDIENTKQQQMKQDRIDELLSTYQGSDKRNNNNLFSNLTAIVHVGPQKTGSSVIQQFMVQHENIIQSLGYHDHYARVPDVNRMVDKSFTSCFNYQPINENKTNERIQKQKQRHYDMIDGMIDDMNEDNRQRSLLQIGTYSSKIDYTCHVETIEQTIQSSVRDHENLLFTSETLSGIHVNVSKLSHFLRIYYRNIYIVAYYRRYFSWIVSLHNQQYKHKNIPTRLSLVDYLQNHKVIAHNIYQGYYFYGSIRRYQQYFSKDQIRYYHLHHINEPSLLEHFFCSAIPDSTHTCAMTRDIIQHEGIPHSNDSIDFIFMDLSYYAHEMNLLSPDIIATKSSTAPNLWIQIVAKAAKHHQYNTLRIANSYDFGNKDAIICPTPETYDLLWNLTIQAESDFFPQYYNDSSQHHPDNEVYVEFQHYVDHYKFCHINATLILLHNSNRWRDFFTKLTLKSINQPDIYPIVLSP